MTNSVPQLLAQAASLVDAGQFAAAEQICRELLSGDSTNVHALHVLGVAQRKSGRQPDAVEILGAALAIQPNHSAVHFELGAALVDLKRLEEALPHFRRAAELNPDFQEACVNTATILERLDRIEEALPWCRRAVELKSNCAIAHFNLGNILRSLGKIDEASQQFEAATELKPQFFNAQWNASLCQLLMGNFAEGWPRYEVREQAGEVAIDAYSQPRWQGESLVDKTILVHAEQGIGDEILFASCLPDLLSQASKVVIVCEPRLESLFARSFPTAEVYGAARRKDRAPAKISDPIDFQIPAGSLPGFFRREKEQFPHRWRFLLPDLRQQQAWRSQFDELGTGLKIGISWRAGGQPMERRKRTTSLAEWMPIFATPGAHFVNLQYGDATDEISYAREQLGVTIHDFVEADPLENMDDFAAKVSALDLVISVGNATVHLAGALGVPAWAILPLVPAWRWMTTGEQSLWYPSVRLFRQRERKEWHPVFEQVAATLANRTGRTGGHSPRTSVAGKFPIATNGTTIADVSGNPSSRTTGHSRKTIVTLADVTASFDAAVQAFDANDLAKAADICRQILDHAPRDAKALHLRGLITWRSGHLDQAVKSLGLSIQVYCDDPQAHFHLARVFSDLGRVDEAIERFRSAITLQPNFWAGHFDLGCALRSQRRYDEAIATFHEAIRLEPNNGKTYNAIAGVYLELKNWNDAERSLRKAIELKPRYMAAFNNLGRCLQLQNRLSEAAEWFRKALAVDATCKQAADNLAVTERDLSNATAGASAHSESILEQKVMEAAQTYNRDETTEAVRLAHDIAAVDPNNLVALRILGVSARQNKDYELSLRHLAHGVQVNPNDYALRFELGVSLLEMYRTREALEHFQQAVELRPNFQPAYVNISAIYEQQEDYDKVVEWTRKARAIKPSCALTHYNLANALRELGQMDEAIAMGEKSVALDPSYVKAEWNLGLARLLVGDYERGWPAFERRIDMGEAAIDSYPFPRWDGSPIPGKTLLIHAEQGIGDEVLFASCFADAFSRVGKCVVICEPRLESIFSRSFPQAKVYGYSRRKDGTGMPLTEKIDAQFPAGSLPLLFRRKQADFPQRKSFLATDEKLVAHWRDRLAALGPGLKIGISWRAGGKPQERRKRMIPLELWRDVLTTPGVQFVNLQYSDSTEEMDRVRNELGVTIHDWEEGDPLVDLDSFAAKIQSLDLVISVGNATVHVAGAVGTPAWTLLPMVPSWRWMVRGEQSPWYPSVLLFRQPQRGNWQAVLDQVAARLRKQFGMPLPNATKSQENQQSVMHDSTWFEAKEIAADVMIESIGTTLTEAEKHLTEKQYRRAEELFREVLQIAPRHYQALHGLGLVARHTGRLDLAIRSFQRSLAMIEPIAHHHFNYAGALAEAGRFDEATKEYTRALEIDPSLSLARIELGRILQRLGEHDQALSQLGKASLQSSENPDLAAHRGVSLAAQCRTDDAIECFQQALRLCPSHLAALVGLANVYLEDQQYEDAERCLRRALAIRPDVAAWRIQLGRVLRQAGRLEESIECLEAAIVFSPDDVTLLADLGTLYRELAQPDMAAEYFQRALQRRSDSPELLNSLGLVLSEQGKFVAAVAKFDQALALNPDYALAHLNRSFALLHCGEFQRAWKEYEWRWNAPRASRMPNFGVTVWDGCDLADKTILIYGEQGVGDEIMFASCYREVIAQAKQAVIVCQPRLEQLFRRSFPETTVVAVPRGQEAMWRPPAQLIPDVQIAAGSLPRLLRNDATTFPPAAGYLMPDATKVTHWQERFAALGTGMKIGISWRAGETAIDRRVRGDSLTPWLPLLATKGVHFVNLQYGDCRNELQELTAENGITVHHWVDADNHNDLEGLAARMAALDLVISVGNANVHLAGALGVPAWALLPHVASWRWYSPNETCLWYSSVRLYRQRQLGNWGELFEQVRLDLLNRIPANVEESKSRVIVGPHFALGTTTSATKSARN